MTRLNVVTKRLGQTPHEATWLAMKAFTEARNAASDDEIWLTEHPPVYTLGLAGKPEHLLNASTGIPAVKIDRGGQITYHGPGQLMAYLMLDLKRRNLGVRALVRLMESAVINFLASHHIAAHNREDAPGVYVTLDAKQGGAQGGTQVGGEAKIAALGLRVKNGCCYHGLALNVDMDLTPFNAINPCGYAGLRVTQLRELGVRLSVADAGEQLTQHLLSQLS